MNAATTRNSNRHSHAASTQEHRPSTRTTHPTRPMPRSTTRVIWTMGGNVLVEYGEVR